MPAAGARSVPAIGSVQSAGGRNPSARTANTRSRRAGSAALAVDGVLAYPFALPGQPGELQGRDAIRAYFGGRAEHRRLFAMEGVEALVRKTDDPEVVVTEITHHGWSHVNDAPYRFTALGVIRVRYDDYMDPIALARLLGRTGQLADALAST